MRDAFLLLFKEEEKLNEVMGVFQDKLDVGGFLADTLFPLADLFRFWLISSLLWLIYFMFG